MGQLVRFLAAVPEWVWFMMLAIAIAGIQQLRVVNERADKLTAQTELANYRTEVAERDRRNAAKSRAEEQRLQRNKEIEDANAREERLALEGDVDRYRDAGVSLQHEVDRLRDGRRATCDAIAAQQRQARPTASMVCGELLGELDQMAGSLGEALGRSRIAGLTCERIADANSQTSPGSARQ